MDYQQARQIRNMPSLSDLIRREAVYGKKGAIGSVKEALKQKLNVKRRTQAKLLGIKEKFDPMNWARIMFGKTGAALYGRAMGRSEADIQYFAGRARPIGGRSYQIGETPKYRGYEPVGSSIAGGGDGGKKLLPTLNKMYDFLKKTHETEIRQRELTANKREELDLEDARRHKELIKTIKAIKVGGTVKEIKEQKEGTGLFDFLENIKNSLRDMFKGMIEDALKVYEWIKDLKILAKIAELGPKIMSVLGWFTGTTLGAALLGIATPLALLAYLASNEKEEIEKNPYDPKYKDNPYAMKLRGEAKSVGEATQQNIAKTLKTFRRNEVEDFVKSDQTDAELVEQFGQNREGLKKWLAENPNKGAVYQAPVRGMGSTGGSSVAPMPDQTDAETKRLMRQSAPKTPEPVPAPAKAEPVTSPPPAAVSTLSQQGADLKLETKFAKPQETVINNQAVKAAKATDNPKVPIPSVRNSEMSFQRMIYESTRVV